MSQKRSNKRHVSGWIVLDKPYDMTSTQAVGKVRWLFNADKAGHAGTLDPLATGILPIALGEATKTVPYVQDTEKRYDFTLVWGTETETDDTEGAPVATSPVRPTRAEVDACLPRFTGIITQVPPIFSAIRIDGERAYDLARAGEAPEMPPRQIEVHELTVLDHDEQQSRFSVRCEKGTYVRALARDIARALGTAGHVGSLDRPAVGAFDRARAVTIAELESIETPEARNALLLPSSAGLVGLPELRLSPHQADRLRHGNPVLLVGAGAPVALDAAWASSGGKAIAVGRVERGQFHPARVLL